MKLIVRLRVPPFKWEDSESSRMTRFIKAEKQAVIDEIRGSTGMKVDIPDPTGQGGTSTSGPVVKRLFGEEMSVLIQLVPEKHRATFERFITNLNCLLLCYSSNREVDVELYKKLVGEVYNDILRNFKSPTGSPWVYPSPTLHGFLSHSLLLIEENQNMGLGKYSEQGPGWRTIIS